MRVRVTFGGGLEVVFSGERTLPSVELHKEPTVNALIAALVGHEKYVPARSDLFLQPGRSEPTLRPGILVLVNDADWELSGGSSTVLSEGDEVLFISTLHGG